MKSGLSFFAVLTAFFAVVDAQSPPQLGTVQIHSGLDPSKCLTVKSNADGAAVVIRTCHNTDSQQWQFSGGQVKIFGNKCLDVKEGVDANGTKLQIWTCSSDNNNQKWFYDRYGFNLQWVKNRGKCVDMDGGILTDGRNVQIYGCNWGNANQIWNPGYDALTLPAKTQTGQYGTNACGTTNSQTSNCQTAWINSIDDFCLWGPPNPNSEVGNTEQVQVAWCTKTGRGTRTIPNGTLKGVHWVETSKYVQITGQGDFTKMNVKAGDSGGELDPHGADANGNPIGGLLYGNTFRPNMQYHEWTEFLSANEFCIRACFGPDATRYCEHIYDVMGCYWNMPANYDSGVFESCKGATGEPMGVYGTSTWHQGVKPTPPGHPAPASSQCASQPTVSSSPLRKRNFARVNARDAVPS
jgi:hypothetical protein